MNFSLDKAIKNAPDNLVQVISDCDTFERILHNFDLCDNEQLLK